MALMLFSPVNGQGFGRKCIQLLWITVPVMKRNMKKTLLTDSFHCAAPEFKDGKASSRLMAKYTIGWAVLLEPLMLTN